MPIQIGGDGYLRSEDKRLVAHDLINAVACRVVADEDGLLGTKASSTRRPFTKELAQQPTLGLERRVLD